MTRKYGYNPFTDKLDGSEDLTETISLHNLSDVTITSGVEHNFLQLNGSSEWVNVAEPTISASQPVLTFTDTDGPTSGTITFAAGGFTVDSLTTFGGVVGVTTYLTTPELSNINGDLKIQPDIQGDVILFGDTDVTNATTDGKSLYIYRMEGTTDGDNYMRFYINQYENSQIIGGTGGRLDITAGEELALNSGGTDPLQLNRTANADVVLFGDTNVGNDEDGKALYIYRNAAETGTNPYFKFYIEDEGTPHLYAYSGGSAYFMKLSPPSTNCYQSAGWAGDMIFQWYGGGGVELFTASGSGSNQEFRICGYITNGAAEQHIAMKVDDTNDLFLLTKEANIAGMDIQMPLIVDDITASVDIDVPEISNTGGDLKIQPDVQGDVVLFTDGTVADAADGKSLYIHRNALTEADTHIRLYLEDYYQGFIYCNHVLNIDGLYGVIINPTGTDVAITPNSGGDIDCFGGATDLAGNVDGKHFRIWRMNSDGDGDNSIDMYIDEWQNCWIEASGPLCLSKEGNADVKFFASIDSGKTAGVQQFGYITAAAGRKFVEWNVNDATDNFELIREDANILNFDVQMPMIADDLTLSSTLDLANGRVSEYRTLCIPVTNPTATDDYLIYRFKEAVTILNVFGVCMDGTSVVFQIMECDGDGDNAAQVIDALTATTSNSTGNITNAGIDAGDYISYDSSAVTGATKLMITIEYKID